MTAHKVYIGSTGPYLFDDDVAIENRDGSWPFVGKYRGAVITDGAIQTTKVPNEAGDMLRFDEIGTKVVGTQRVIESFTATGTIDADTNVVLANGTFDLFLPVVADPTVWSPDPQSGEKKVYEVKNIGTGIVTLKPNSSEPTVEIEGETSQPIYPGDCFSVLSDATKWWVI